MPILNIDVQAGGRSELFLISDLVRSVPQALSLINDCYIVWPTSLVVLTNRPTKLSKVIEELNIILPES